MKWKIKKTEPPKDGAIRTRRVFAWRKTKVGDYWVWLETYQLTERRYVSVSGEAWWREVGREPLEYMY